MWVCKRKSVNMWALPGRRGRGACGFAVEYGSPSNACRLGICAELSTVQAYACRICADGGAAAGVRVSNTDGARDKLAAAPNPGIGSAPRRRRRCGKASAFLATRAHTGPGGVAGSHGAVKTPSQAVRHHCQAVRAAATRRPAAPPCRLSGTRIAGERT